MVGSLPALALVAPAVALRPVRHEAVVLAIRRSVLPNRGPQPSIVDAFRSVSCRRRLYFLLKQCCNTVDPDRTVGFNLVQR